MTWNNYLQSLDRWIQDLSFRDSTAYTRWRKGTSAVCRDGRETFLIGNAGYV